MRITYCKCDRCGREFSYEPAEVRFDAYVKGTYDITPHLSDGYHRDLCAECCLELMEFFGIDVNDRFREAVTREFTEE